MKINYLRMEEMVKHIPKEERLKWARAFLEVMGFADLKDLLHEHIDSQTPENFYPTLQVLVEVLEHYKDAVEALKEEDSCG